MTTTTRLTILIFILATTCRAQTIPFPIDEAHLQTGKFRYGMYKKSDSLGYSIIEIKKENNQWVISEDAHVKANFELKEIMFSYLKPKTWQWDSLTVTGAFNKTKKFTSLAIQNKNRVSANSDYTTLANRPECSIDSLFNKPHVDRLSSLFFFPPLLDFSKQKQFSYLQFNPTDCQFREITVKRTSEQKITTQRGEIDTYLLEFSGGMARQLLYISKEAPHTIVRIEFADNDWVYLLK